MEKNKYRVLETMEWRNKEYSNGEIIEDSDNSYMRAMVHQGKIERVD